MTKPTSERSAYEVIADELGRLIAEGAYAPGEPLPASNALQERFGVADGTIRKAVAVLEKRGLVARNQGRAPLVQGPGNSAGTLREQAAGRLRELIADGTYPAGSVLPSELELKTELGVSRETLRAALKALEESGEVARRSDLRRQVTGAEAGAETRYEQVAERLRGDLAAGVYKSGSLLPGEGLLATTYGVSRPTVSAALNLLEQAGAIHRTDTGRRRVGGMAND